MHRVARVGGQRLAAQPHVLQYRRQRCRSSALDDERVIHSKIVEELLYLAYLAIAPGRCDGPVAVRMGLEIVKPHWANSDPPPTLCSAELADQRADEEILKLACSHRAIFVTTSPAGNADGDRLTGGGMLQSLMMSASRP